MKLAVAVYEETKHIAEQFNGIQPIHSWCGRRMELSYIYRALISKCLTQ